MPYYIVASRSDPTKTYVCFVPYDDSEPPWCECWSYKLSKGPIKTCYHIQDELRARRAASGISSHGEELTEG